jgi:hypothetical protein
MRCGIVAFIMLTCAATASAQGGARVATTRLSIHPSLSSQMALPQPHVSPDDVIARLMSFDRDRDGRVTITELSERMQSLVARGDKSGDGALDASELRTLATSPPFVEQALRNLSGGYGFTDTVGQSSRSHVENSIDDLRLAVNSGHEAKRIAVAYVEEFEGSAAAHMRSALAPLVSTESLPALERDLKILARQASAMVQVRFLSASNSQMVLSRHQLSLEQMRIAEAAAEAFQAEQKFDASRQAALVARLSGVLSEEESDNLRAALARRPLARPAGVAAGIQRVSGEGLTIMPVVR